MFEKGGKPADLERASVDTRVAPLAEVVVRAAPDGLPLIKAPTFAAPILAHGLLCVRGRDRVVCRRLPKTIAEPPAR